MNNIHYDFANTGYKIHLPVVPEPNDPLTRKIIDYLDDKFGLAHHSQVQYKETCYKLGSGGELMGGKGITLFGKTGSMQEMQELAKEIEEKFGKELADNVKKYNITFEDPIKLSNSVQARFSVYYHYVTNVPKPDIGLTYPLQTYERFGNPSGAIPTHYFTGINGVVRRIETEEGLKSLSNIDKKFWFGDSTMYAIDHFGELFTGKVEQGKVPQFILNGLPKEYLEHYNLTEKDIVDRINKGTRTIVANMLEDIVNRANSKILCSDLPWLTTLDTKVIDEAKQLLASYEPETVKKLEQMLPQLEQKCSGLSVLRKTTPFSQMKIVPAQKCTSFYEVAIVRHPTKTGKPQITTNIGTTNPVHTVVKPTNPQASSKSLSWVNDVYAKFKAPKATPIATPSVVTTVNKQQTLAKQIVDSLTSKGGKNVLCIAGVSLLTLGAISIFNQSKKNMVANNRVTKRENSRQINVFNNRGNLTV